MLAVELAAAEGGNVTSGLLVLPFRLRLDAGVGLAIDETAAMLERQFSTYLAAGCVVPMGFDAVKATALRALSTRKCLLASVAFYAGKEVVPKIWTLRQINARIGMQRLCVDSMGNAI